jgi:hypothetical protein
MRTVLFAILAGSSTLASPTAFAQTQQSPTTGPAAAATPTPSSPTATLADCDRLLVVLEQRRPANLGITAEQVRAYRASNNPQGCRDALNRIDPSGAAAGAKEGDATSIVVKQQQPQVTVRQPQPEIIVRQPAATVTVEIPQPEIIVRMPKPEVNVAMSQPQVQVNQPAPNIQVTQPQQPQVQVQPAEPRVNLQTGPAANVQVHENTTPPTIRYERAEPKVVINQAPGEPKVRMEAAERAPATTGARTGEGVTVARVKRAGFHSWRSSFRGRSERRPDTKHAGVGSQQP